MRSLIVPTTICLAITTLLGSTCSADDIGNLSRVGTTKDACDKKNEVRFAGKAGDAKVAADSSKLVELPATTRELFFYCGGARERCANDEPFNVVMCERAGNGAIVWTFYMSDKAVGTHTLKRVGTTKDACDKGNQIRFAAKEGDVKVVADSSKLAELPATTRELFWYCGGTRERCANDEPFNVVMCERAGNGAIVWTFYTK